MTAMKRQDAKNGTTKDAKVLDSGDLGALAVCAVCKGTGRVSPPGWIERYGTGREEGETTCLLCRGTGRVRVGK